MNIMIDNDNRLSSIVQDDYYFIGATGMRSSSIYGYRMSMYSSVKGGGFSNIETFEIKRK